MFHAFDVLSEAFVFVADVFERQHVFDAFEQFDAVDGFGDKVVSADFDGSLDVPQFIEGGDHQDHNRFGGGVALEFLADLKAAELWHHDIEQDEVGMEGGDLIQGRLPVFGHFDFAGQTHQIGLQQFAVGLIIVSDQDFVGCHGGLISYQSGVCVGGIVGAENGRGRPSDGRLGDRLPGSELCRLNITCGRFLVYRRWALTGRGGWLRQASVFSVRW